MLVSVFFYLILLISTVMLLISDSSSISSMLNRFASICSRHEATTTSFTCNSTIADPATNILHFSILFSVSTETNTMVCYETPTKLFLYCHFRLTIFDFPPFFLATYSSDETFLIMFNDCTIVQYQSQLTLELLPFVFFNVFESIVKISS